MIEFICISVCAPIWLALMVVEGLRSARRRQRVTIRINRGR